MTSNRTVTIHSQKPKQRGSVAIELALVVPLLLVLAAAVIDYGWFISRESRVVLAVRDAARLGATYGGDAVDPPDIVAQQRAIAALGEAGIACGAGCTVTAVLGNIWDMPSLTVSVTTPYRPLTGLLPTPPELSAELTIALEIRNSRG